MSSKPCLKNGFGRLSTNTHLIITTFDKVNNCLFVYFSCSINHFQDQKLMMQLNTYRQTKAKHLVDRSALHKGCHYKTDYLFIFFMYNVLLSIMIKNSSNVVHGWLQDAASCRQTDRSKKNASNCSSRIIFSRNGNF